VGDRQKVTREDTTVKRALYVALAALVAMLIMVPTSMAQEEGAEIAEEQAEDPQEPLEENIAEGQQEAAFEEQVEAQQGFELTPRQEAALEPQAELEGVEPEAAAAQPKMEGTMMKETTSPLPKSGGIGIGGPSLLLPAIALLMGGGILGYAIVRRR
jgi:hypothetical protein